MPSSPEINKWNEGWRSSPQYRDILVSVGINPDQRFKLSDRQRKQVEAAIERTMEFQFPDGVEIDPAGNMNENEGFGKHAKRWGPIIGAAALTAFGIPGVMPGLLSGGGAAAGGASAATGAGGAAAGGVLPSAAIGGLSTAVPGALSSGIGAAGAAGAAGGAGGLFGTIAKGLGAVGGTGNVLRGAGATLGAIAAGRAHNRGEEFSGQMDLEQLLMDRERDHFDRSVMREQEGRASGSDAWRKLLAAERTGNPGQRPQLSPYSVAPRQPAEREMYGAHMMAEEAMKRFTGGNAIAPVARRPLDVDRSLLQPGRFEGVSRYLSPILSGAGWAMSRPNSSSR